MSKDVYDMQDDISPHGPIEAFDIVAAKGGSGRGEKVYLPDDFVLDGTNPPTLTAANGTDGQQQYDSLDFAHDSTDLAFINDIVPNDYYDDLMLELYWFNSATTGGVTFDGAVNVTPPDATDDLDDAGVGIDAVTVTVPGTTLYLTKTVLRLGTRNGGDGGGPVTGIKPGKFLQILLQRTHDATGDTAAAATSLVAARLSWRKG